MNGFQKINDRLNLAENNFYNDLLTLNTEGIQRGKIK